MNNKKENQFVCPIPKGSKLIFNSLFRVGAKLKINTSLFI